jgi:hypothetical protein
LFEEIHYSLRITTMTGISKILLALAFVAPALAGRAADTERGFTALFNGTDLSGWKLVGKKGEGYGVKDGVIYCAKGGGGNLLTEKEYGDFVFPLRVQAGGGRK